MVAMPDLRRIAPWVEPHGKRTGCILMFDIALRIQYMMVGQGPLPKL